MAFVIKRKKGAPEASLGGNLVDAGTYQAYIYNAKFEDFGGQGKNADTPSLNLSFKIAPEQGPMSGRVVFMSPKLLLADRWAPTEKNPDGAPNFMLWQFLSSVDEEGRTPKEILDAYNKGGDIEIPDGLEGTLVTITVQVRKNTWNGVTEDRNSISKIAPAVEGGESNSVTPTVAPGGKKKLTL